jgi:DNA gyrase subunit A
MKGLFKWTALQTTFGVIALALDNGVPREFSLKAILERYRDHRVEVLVRRSRWELDKARDEAHVLEGLQIAVKNIDEVVRLIRGSKDRDTAARKLCKQFKLTERQADAILAMRLARLTALETRELKNRLGELARLIRELEALLASPVQQIAVVRRELEGLEQRYADARRTTILESEADFHIERLVANEDVTVTVSHEGYIKRIPMNLYRRRVNSGKPLAGMERYDTDYLEHVFVAGTYDSLMFFTGDGQAHWLSVLDVPEAGRSSRGRAMHQILGIARHERIAAMLAMPRQIGEEVLVFATEQGTVKRTPLDQFAHPRAGGIVAIGVKPGDRVMDVQLSDGGNDVVLVTRSGRAIRFHEAEVSPMGRTAQGVRGINLRKDDRLVGMVVVRRDATLCTVTEQGFAKRSLMGEFGVQKRGGLGTVVMATSGKTGLLVAAKEVLPGDEMMLIAASGRAVRLAGNDVPVQSRATQGEPLLDLAEGDHVVEVTRVAGKESEEGGEPESDPAEVQYELVATAEE